MVGAWAYNFYADARPTGDYDFFLPTDDQSEAAIRLVLTDFGFGSTLPPQETRLLQPGKVIMLGRKPMRIDLLTAIDGVRFEEAWQSRVAGSFGGLPMNFISKELLIRNKSATGREKDLRDVAVLKQV